MATVVSDPANDWALHRHAPGDGKRDAERTLGLESAVGEVTVEADRDAMAGEGVETHHQHNVVPADPPIPQQWDRGDNGSERDQDDRSEKYLLSAGFEPAPRRRGRSAGGACS